MVVFDSHESVVDESGFTCVVGLSIFLAFCQKEIAWFACSSCWHPLASAYVDEPVDHIVLGSMDIILHRWEVMVEYKVHHVRDYALGIPVSQPSLLISEHR